MKNIFQKADIKTYTIKVSGDDIAKFEGGVVHNVYSTFALGRDAEWCTRLFVLEMKEEDEEGIGTFLHVEHISPALLGSEVVFTAMIELLHGNNIECSFEAKCRDRIIAKGRTAQKILKIERLEMLFSKLE